MNRFFLSTVIAVMAVACSTKLSVQEQTATETQVKLTTSKGEITIHLYNETPLHRDNFIKIVEEGVLDSLLFHRVIETFMIQGGDPDSKLAGSDDTLGNGGLAYTIPAEFHPDLFHKKGALGAARDNNPEKASSSTQFYIVQGRVLNDSLIDMNQGRINGWLAESFLRKDSSYMTYFDSMNIAMKNSDRETYRRIANFFKEEAEQIEEFESYEIPEAHRQVYRTLGGTPHLDQNYTVFGEVVSGIEVVDSIAAVATNSLDRPIQDVRILKAEVIQIRD
ncbi:peptidylprolyl isomerase [Marinoscillum pacificum]|uniref:peptidylprolyl isomerase n=1 Tax=Marinoscillum pacificum TaxID=392723 RepID=UPI00215826E6|nr:peptidylprolyl isomerase [Marinoscillum pacificum]